MALDRFNKNNNPLLSFIHAAVYSNMWVAFSATCLGAATFLRYQFPFDLRVLGAIFLMTYAAYWFLRHPQDAQPVHPASRIVRYQVTHKKLLLPTAIVAGIAGLFISFSLTKNAQLIIVIAAVLSLLYSSIVVKNPLFNLGLRNIPGIKIVIIALSWVLITYMMPLQESGTWDLAMHWVGFLEQFLFIIAITLPFDIRDKPFDRGTIKTLPILLGTNTAKRVAITAVVASGLLAVFQWWNGHFGWQVVVPIWLCLETTTLFVWLTHSKRSDLFFSLGVESLPVLLFFLLLIFRYF